MDEAPLLTETGVRALLVRVASDDAPPTSVSIARARTAGRRRRRLVRVYLPGAAPVAAAATVALIAGLTAHLSGTASAVHHHAASAAQHHQRTVPATFSLQRPYAAFGWLPAGFSAAGLANGSVQSSTSLTATARASLADGRMVSLTVNAAGSCRITSDSLKARTAETRFWPASSRKFSHELDCTDFAPPLGKRAPDVSGSPAYWTLPQGGLAWEYGHDAWATLIPMPNAAVCVHCAVHRGLTGWFNELGRNGHPAVPQSHSAQLLLLRIAAGVRVGISPTIRTGFTLAGLPRNWTADRNGNSVSFAILDNRLADVGWSAGPADDPTALGISVTPASTLGAIDSCNYVAGQSRYTTLDGARVMLRTIDQPYKHWEELCAPDVRGLSVYITLDTNIPATDDKPLPGGRAVGGVVTIFHRLRLLGPDVGRWTTQQPG
jgi:hypothetical protein